MSHEKSITIEVAELNQGRPTNIPSVRVDGLGRRRQLSDEEAVTAALRAAEAGQAFDSFDTLDQAVEAAETRSRAFGGALFNDRGDPLKAAPLARPEDLGASYLRRRAEQGAARETEALMTRVARRRAGTGGSAELPGSRPKPEAAADDGKAGEKAAAVAKDVGRGVVETPRAVITAVVDAGLELSDNLVDLGRILGPAAEAGDGDTPVQDLSGGQVMELIGRLNETLAAGVKAATPDNPKSVTGNLVKGVSQFLIGFIPAVKATRALGITKQGGAAARIAEGALAGSLADVAVIDEREARLANLVEEVPALKTPVTDFLKATPGDSVAEGKFKQALEGLIAGPLADGLLETVKFLARARQARGDAGKGKADELAEARAEFGEITERDFLILGDPNEPLFRVEGKAPESGAEKLRRGEQAVDDLIGPHTQDEAATVGTAAAEGGRAVFVNFARIEGPDEIRQVIGQMTDAFKADIDEARRGVITQEQTTQLADELGMSVPDLLARRKGQPLNAEEAVAARRLWASSAGKLLETARLAAQPNAGAADQFNFRRMLALHHAIQSEVIGARTETARALNAWKIPAGGDVEKAREIQLLMNAMGGPEASQEMARRLALLEAVGADPAAISAFARRGWSAATADVIKEVWVNGLLSSPKTHVVNITSNTAVAFQQIMERGAAAQFAKLRGAGDGVAPGEAAAMAYGLVSSLQDAFRLSWQATLTGDTGAALGKIDLPRRRALSAEAFDLDAAGPLGRTVDFLGAAFRVPGRLLGAEDEFFKTINFRMELHAQALRQATGEGLEGPALGLRMRELIAEPPEHLRIKAADAALYATFTNQPGWFGQAVLKLRGAERAASPVPFVLPFVRTPVNIARYAFERTPFAPLVGQWRADIAAGGARRDLALARMATGSGIMLLAADYADSGLVSGRGPKDPGERAALLRQGWQPYSIKVGERWFSYNRADPFGMTMGFAADTTEAVKRGEIDDDDVDEWNEVVALSIAAISQVTINKTYMSGFAEFNQMMSDPSRYSTGYVNDFVGSFVPFTSLMRGVEQLGDPTLSDVNTPADAVTSRILGLSDRLPRRRDLWGEVIDLSSGLGKSYDFFAPWSARAVKKSPIDAELTRLGADVRRIRKKTSFAGVNVNFRDWPEVYEAYVTAAGNGLKHPAYGLGARDLLDQLVTGKHALSVLYELRGDGKDGGKANFIREQIRQYRELAQRAILADPQFEDFAEHVGDLIEQKRAERLPVLQGAAP